MFRKNKNTLPLSEQQKSATDVLKSAEMLLHLGPSRGYPIQTPSHGEEQLARVRLNTDGIRLLPPQVPRSGNGSSIDVIGEQVDAPDGKRIWIHRVDIFRRDGRTTVDFTQGTQLDPGVYKGTSAGNTLVADPEQREAMLFGASELLKAVTDELVNRASIHGQGHGRNNPPSGGIPLPDVRIGLIQP
jgi:hypothetical protein